MTMPWLGKGIITSLSEEWREQRKLLTTSFNVNILSKFIPIIFEQSQIFVNIIREKSDGKTNVDVSALCLYMALDIICGKIILLFTILAHSPNAIVLN